MNIIDSSPPAGAVIAADGAAVRDQLSQILETIVLRCGSLRGAGQRCGKSTMWIWRQLRQNKSFDLAKVADALATLEVPLRFFLEEAADASPAFDPGWVLEHLHPGTGPLDPFLTAAKKRIALLLDLPALGSHTPRRRREIEDLEEKRVLDPERAKPELEILAGELLDAAESSAAAARGVARGHLADGARLLLAWSALQRSMGRRENSVESCALAGRLAEAAADPLARGIFYLHASRLLSDLEQPGQAWRFAQAACGALQCERKSGLLAEAIVQKSIALAGLHQPHESRIEALAALRLAARTDWRTRTSAWLQLANLAESRGDGRRALGCLGRAQRMARAGRLKALLEWRRAVILGSLGRVPEANLAFRAAIAVFEKQNLPLLAARIAVDHLDASLRNGRFQDVLARVQASSPFFEQLGGRTRAFELWMDLCALLLAEGSRALPLGLVAAVRRALEESSPGLSSLAKPG